MKDRFLRLMLVVVALLLVANLFVMMAKDKPAFADSRKLVGIEVLYNPAKFSQTDAVEVIKAYDDGTVKRITLYYGQTNSN